MSYTFGPVYFLKISMLHKILPYLDLFGQTMSLKYFHEVDIFWSIMIFPNSSYNSDFWKHLMTNSIVKNMTTKLSIISIMKTIQGNWTLPEGSCLSCGLAVIWLRNLEPWSLNRHHWCSYWHNDFINNFG